MAFLEARDKTSNPDLNQRHRTCFSRLKATQLSPNLKCHRHPSLRPHLRCLRVCSRPKISQVPRMHQHRQQPSLRCRASSLERVL